MVKRKSQKSQSRKQEENIFTGTKKLADTAIKAHKVGGMPLVLVIVGLIILVFAILFKSMFDIITFVVLIIVCILLFIGGIYIYVKENKII